MSMLDQAILFATQAHEGQHRKTTDLPYIVHPMEVMKIVSLLTEDEEIRAAAVLHDTLEDTKTTKDDLLREFGGRVCELVCKESEQKKDEQGIRRSWRDRKLEKIEQLRTCQDRGVLLICLGDKLANLRDLEQDYIRCGDALWAHFNEKDPQEHAWYFRSMRDILRPAFETTPAWMEMCDTILRLFGEESMEHTAVSDRKLF